MTDDFTVPLGAVEAFAKAWRDLADRHCTREIYLHFDPATDYARVSSMPEARFLEVVGTYFDEDDLPGTCERLNAALAKWRAEHSRTPGGSLVEVLDGMEEWHAAVQHLRDLIEAGRITHV